MIGNRLGSGPNGIADIKCHSFFASIDWDKLLKKQVNLSSSQGSGSESVWVLFRMMGGLLYFFKRKKYAYVKI